MWISAQVRPVWSLSASELIPWAEAGGAAARRGSRMARSLESIAGLGIVDAEVEGG